MYVARVVLGVLIVGSLLVSPASALAQDEYGLDTVAGAAELKGNPDDTLPKITGRFLGAVLSLVGILFFILTIYGGVLWMTSHGNAEQASKGSKTAIAAIIGLIIVLASYTITNFVFNTVKGGEGAGQVNAPEWTVSLCQQRFGEAGFACRAESQCNPTTIQRGLCPGPTNIVCCEVGTALPVRRCVDGGNIGCRRFSTQIECDTGAFRDMCSWFDTECTYDGPNSSGCASLSATQCVNHDFCQLQ